MTGALDPQVDPRSGRLSASSATSLLSNDSGYASMSTEPEPRTVKKSFGLSSLFGRKAKPTFTFNNLEEASSSAAVETELAQPVRTAPVTPIAETIIEAESEQSTTT